MDIQKTGKENEVVKRLAIMGAGSMGMILGAYIAKSGRQVDLIDANRAHVDAMNKKGAAVTGYTEMTIPVNALTPDEMEGTYDIFFLMTKQTFNADAFASIKKHLAPDGTVVTLQNGLPEPACCKEFGEDRVLGAPMFWGATWIAPGVSKITTPENGHRRFLLGSVSGAVTPQMLEVKEILEAMCPVQVSENLLGLRWRKLMNNAVLSGMSAVIGGTMGDVMDHAASFYGATLIAREAYRTAKASRISLFYEAGEPDLNAILDFRTEEERKVVERFLLETEEHSRALKASMLQDLEKGKKTEVDAINGVISAAGRQYGIPTPACDLVVRLIHSYESKHCIGTLSNADIFLHIPIK